MTGWDDSADGPGGDDAAPGMAGGVGPLAALMPDEQRRVLEDLARNLPGALFTYKRFPDGHDTIHYMSPGCQDIWELSAAEIGEDPSLLWRQVHEDDVEAMRASVVMSAETLTPWSHRWRNCTPSGRRKWLHGRGQPRRLEDGSVLWNSLILDVTEQMTAEEELAASREMFHQARKIETLGQLTGGIAHDFNNLLAVIQGNLEIVRERAADAAMRECLDDAWRAAMSGAGLTAQLLAFSRHAPMRVETLSPDAVIGALRRLLERTLPASVTLELDLGAGAVAVALDRSRLENAVLNLVLNARDAIEGPGRVTIETRRTCALPAQEGVGGAAAADAPRSGGALGHVVVAVRDTGRGMSEDVRLRAFDPFFTTKAVGEGTGMGLSTVEGFVHQSHGFLRIETAPGAGTAVLMHFPLVDGMAAVAADEAGAGASGGGATVLVVDDNPAVRTVVERMLAALGYRVLGAVDAEAALARLEEAPGIAAVLSDVVMPGVMQGGALAAEIERRWPGLPVLLMSGFPAHPSLEAPASGRPVLAKPLGKAALGDALAAALAQGRWGA